MMLAKKSRLFWMGLLTILGIKQLGFFIPYRYAKDRGKPGKRLPYPEVESQFEKLQSKFEVLISYIDNYSEDLRKIGPDNPPQPRWNQNWFPPLDATMAYTLVRHIKPKQIIEIGSGHSTRFLCRAINDGQLDTQLTAIDPKPRADIKGLKIKLVETVVQNLDTELFSQLKSGDFLFIDSSHIIMPGTDLDFIFNRVLTMLPEGVIIHIHDIFLPDDYPESWSWRGYNEQLAVALLIHGKSYEVLFSSHYSSTRMNKLIENTVPFDIKRQSKSLDTSLWLKKSTN